MSSAVPSSKARQVFRFSKIAELRSAGQMRTSAYMVRDDSCSGIKIIEMPPSSSIPVVKISRRGALRLQEGHVWVYRSDIVSADGVAPGTAVGVADERGKFLGTALYSSASQIAIRMISPRTVDDLPNLFRERIQAAISYRERVVRDTDA